MPTIYVQDNRNPLFQTGPAIPCNKREEEIIKHEMELAEHEKEMARYEAALEEEKVKILEQYKRVKKLERQGKR